MRITIISLDHLGYNKYIVEELKTHEDVEVYHISFDKIRYVYPTYFHRIANFFLKNTLNINLKKIYIGNTILEKVKRLAHQDKILIIKGERLPINTIKELKKNCSQLIAFHNDNVQRYPRIKAISPYFDVNFSFERKDVLKYNFKFITNFMYHKHLVSKPDSKQKIEYEVFNVSSLDKRSPIIEEIALVLDKINIKYKIILVGKKNHIPKENIIYQSKKIDLEDVNHLISKSATLLDVHRKRQTGLSFRVMDSLGFHKKIITTNTDVVNYDFYNQNNILIINPKKIEIPKSFFETDYEEIPKNIYDKYTMKEWVKTVFELKE